MGIELNTWGNHSPSEIIEIAKLAEKLGFERVWMGDHIVAPLGNVTEHPYQPGILRQDQQLYDIWTVLGAVAAATRTIGIGTGIYVLPLRHPLLSATASVTLQNLAGGRFVLGVGAGWKREEFVALGADFDRRGRHFDETLDLLRELWNGGPVTYRGDLYALPTVAVCEAPVNIPVICGGNNPAALRRAAAKGDGWYNPSACGLDDCVRIRAHLTELRMQLGRQGEFSYHFRVKNLSKADVEKARAVGFNNMVVPWTLIEPLGGPGLDTAGKLRALEGAAKKLGVLRRL
jgi:probable F420-dependent oxidoreductase